jgi:hypothetical protein
MKVKWWAMAVALVALLVVFEWQVFRDMLPPGLRPAGVPLRELRPWPTDFRQTYPSRFPLQVAVLWLTPDPTPLGLCHAFRQMGVPFCVTDRLDEALQHPLVVIGPAVEGRTLSPAQADQLSQFVTNGGVAFIQLPFWGGLKPLCGFRDYQSTRTRHWLSFTATSDPVLRHLNRPEERQVCFGAEGYPEVIWTTGYTLQDPNMVVLAEYKDRTVALARRDWGKGVVYVSGVDLNHVIIRNQTNHDPEAERWYMNHFEPGTDVWMLLLRAWYETHQPDAVRLATMPDGYRSALVLTHDVDGELSISNCLAFAALERRLGVGSTFFMQTKYLKDAQSRRFFCGPTLDILRQLKEQGFGVQSHTVSHCEQFHRFPRGTGKETFREYRTYVGEDNSCPRGTVFGEVRVSKELLDGELPGQNTVAFRAGHLKFPRTLPEVLERCGYEFDSSQAANDVLTQFPYAIPLNLEFAQDSQLYELPIALEDEEAPPLAQRLDGARDLIEANAENGAFTVALIHPDSPDKLAAEEALLQRLPKDIAVSELLSFARFWRARDRLTWTVKPRPDSREIELAVTSPETLAGLTVEFRRPVETVVHGGGRLLDTHRLVLPELTASNSLSLLIRYAP